MGPKNKIGQFSAASSNELIVSLAPLAVQPAGEVFILNDVKPMSAQSSQTLNYKENTKKLKNRLIKSLKEYKANLKVHSNGKLGAVSLKVLFLLGKKDKEKDIDNMLKWFCDQFKEVTKVDDAVISDMRGIKKRLEHSENGLVGFSIKTNHKKVWGDIENASMIAIINSKGKTPDTINECIKVVSNIREYFQNINKPKF